MDPFLDWALALRPVTAAACLFVLNVVTFALAVLLGELALRASRGGRVTPPPDPLSAREVIYTTAGIVANWLITVVAWLFWRAGIVVIRRDLSAWVLVEVPLFLLVMDFAMYVLHRAVHLPWFFPLHRLHHEYDRPRPLSLFVLNPLETISFGLLWIVVLLAYSWSWLGLSIYLALNLGSGTLGHLGVEPFPAWFGRVPLLRQVGTSTFHAQHHQDVNHNFGFYTLIWDRLFGTLVPDYDARFGRPLPEPDRAAAEAR